MKQSFICIILVSIFFISNLIAQDFNENKIPEFSTSSLVIANDFIFSVTLSYERIVPLKKQWNLALRGGGGYTAESGDDLTCIVQSSFLYGKSKHFFETGVAYYQNLTYPDAFIIPIVGYRFMGEKGFVFKAFGDLLMDVIDDSEWGFLNPGFHLSVGWRFNI